MLNALLRPDGGGRVYAEIAKAKRHMFSMVAEGIYTTWPHDKEKCAVTQPITGRTHPDCGALDTYSFTRRGCKIRAVSGFDRVFEQVHAVITPKVGCIPQAVRGMRPDLISQHAKQKRKVPFFSGLSA